MKKALSIILALVNVQTLSKSMAIVLSVVLLSVALIPMAALAADLSIQLEKSNYDPGEAMVITFKNIPARGSGWWFATTYKTDLSGYNNGLTGQSLIGAHVVGDYSTGVGTQYAPTIPGEYAVVLFNESEVIIASATYTVGAVVKDGHISLDKTAYTAMETITVSYTGITQNMVNSGAKVVIYPKGSPHDGRMEGGGGDVSLGSGSFTTMAPNKNGEFEARLYSLNQVFNDETFIMSVPFTVSGATGSEWAQGELEKANAMGLIPDSLKGQDLTKPITRSEFAGVVVKLYENLTGETVSPLSVNPFDDTSDTDVLKSCNANLMVGMGAGKFNPDRQLTREEAATALTRVLKRTYIEGWTFETDGNYTLTFDMPAKFADDASISSWARESVYFMAANKIIEGKGNNMFAPKNTTAAEEAINFGGATREAAVILSVRMVENLKEKGLEFTSK